MRSLQRNYRRAFTLMESLMVVAALALLLAVLLPMAASMSRKSNRLGCDNNFRQIGIAFRIWEGDNGDKYPMAVSATNGGAEELVATGNVAACFQVLSNELATPKFLICPVDSQHHFATNFDNGFSRANISYFIGLNATEDHPSAILSGDDNLVSDDRTIAGMMIDLSRKTATWSGDRHHHYGYVLHGDGSTQIEGEIGGMASVGFYSATNCVVVP